MEVGERDVGMKKGERGREVESISSPFSPWYITDGDGVGPFTD